MAASRQVSSKADGGERCEPVDRVTPSPLSEGWDSAPEKVTWRDGSSTRQQEQAPFTRTFSARGRVSGELHGLTGP
ncbi:hypothetical protein AB0O01_35240 [Streptomyces sp. NPDC093252]|uniref:hypothetical protein n=1 Tax=Streptomyces sp. NPDC093252 TaxID=3154980 RepID=UPI0034394210